MARYRGTVLHFGAAETLAIVVRSHFEPMREAGWNSVVCCDPGAFAPFFDEVGVEIIENAARWRPNFGDLVTAARELLPTLIRRKFHIVHTHNAHHGILGRTIGAMIQNTRTVHTWRYNPLDAASNDAKRYIYQITEQFAGLMGDAVLFQNRDDMRDAIKLGMTPKHKAYFIGNGIPIDEVQYDVNTTTRHEVRHDVGIPENAWVIGAIARLDKRKGLEHAIIALSHLRQSVPQSHLVLVGWGPDEARLRALTEQYGLTGYVHFLGFRRDARRLIRGFDVAILPSRREGLSKALMEAMVARTPVIASDVVGNRELIVHGVSGVLVPFGDPVALAEAAAGLAHDRARANLLAESAWTCVRQRHNERDVVLRIVGIYDRLMEGTG